jgi:hypothetical protein
MVTTSSELRVRRLQIKDFPFVRDLAGEQPNFTIPPPYVLWLLLKIRNNVALIVEREDIGPVGYLLAVPVEQPKTLYVWQLAQSKRDKHGQGALLLLSKLRDIASRKNVSFIRFSAIPGSATYRAIRLNVLKISGTVPELIGSLLPIIAPQESEFCVRLRPDTTAKQGHMKSSDGKRG